MDLQLLWAKPEVTYGVDPVAVAANTVRCEQVTCEPAGSRVTSDTSKPGSGAEADQTYGEHYVFGFKVPLIGGGTAGVAPKFGPILKSCAYGETIVADTSVAYAPLFSGLAATSHTFVFRDGNRRRHLIKGWRGRVSYELSAGGRPMLAFMGLGLHTDVTKAAAVIAQADADFTGWHNAQTVAQGTTTLTFAGVAGLGIRELKLDQQDNVKFVDLPEQENVEIRGPRLITGNMRFTTQLADVFNAETKWRTGAVETFAMVHGATAGKIVTINGRAQITSVRYPRDNEQDTTDVGLKLVPSTLSTDDEISLVFT